MHNKKDRTIAGVIVFVTLAIIIVLVVTFIGNHVDNGFSYDGWIDCMPPLSKSESDLCERAKAAGYPYIAY